MAPPGQQQGQPPDDLTPKNALGEYGYAGLVQYGGYIEEEFVPELKGERRHKVYAEMARNDAVIGASLFVIDKLLRQVPWDVEPATEGDNAQEHADFLWSCTEDMEHTWTAWISQVAAFLIHGYSLFETVYRRRRMKDGSKHDDGRLGWRKFGYRSAETIPRWDFDDETGQCIAAVQCGPPSYREVRLPLSRCMLFRTTADKDNPEGRSALRTAYRAWYLKKRIEEIEGVGIERDLAGLPVIYAPASAFRKDATDGEKALLAELVLTVKRLRNNEHAGVVLPSLWTKDGSKRELELTLLSTGGRRQIDLSPAINRYNAAIASTFLTDFILLGHEKVGSFALADSKTAVFAVALGAWLDMIAEEINRVEVPRLFRLNGLPTDNLPRLIHGDIERQDLQQVGDYVAKLSAAGVLLPDPALERHLRRVADLPEPPEED